MSEKHLTVSRRRAAALSVLLCLLWAAPAAARAKEPPRDIFGVRLGMGAEEARRRLDRVGRRVTDERMKHEVWELDDERVSHVGVRFRDGRVRWVIATARAASPRRLRYRDLGDPRRAEHKTDGTNHTYIWRVPARGRAPAHVVVAGGSDPVYLTSYRILRSFEDQ